MKDSRLIGRVGSASGMIFAALLVAAYLTAPPMPVAGTPGTVLVRYVRANSAGLELSWFLASGPALFLGGWFLGVVAVTVWDAGAPRHLIGAGISSAFLAGALLTAAGVSWGLFVYLAPQLDSGSLVLVLAESRHFAEGAISFPAGAAAAALSLTAWSFGRGWRSVAALGLAAAALQLGNGLDDFAADGVTGALGPLAFFALMLWIAAFSFGLTLSSKLERRPQPATSMVGRILREASHLRVVGPVAPEVLPLARNREGALPSGDPNAS